MIRTVVEQIPETGNKIAILRPVYQHFEDPPHRFEGFATRIFQMHDRRVIIDETHANERFAPISHMRPKLDVPTESKRDNGAF